MLIDNGQCINLITNELNNNGKISLTVHGNSMFPTLNDGETVTVIKSEQYNIGDIIAYYTITDNLVTIIVHRVIFTRSKYVLTKGDNNSFVDPLKINLCSILGKVEKEQIRDNVTI